MTRQTLIKYFFGIFIILFVFWNRFLRNRYSVSYFSLPIEIIILLKIIIILFFVTIFYTSLKKLFGIQKQSYIIRSILNNKLSQKILFLCKEYISESPEFMYNKFTQHINLAPLLELPASYFTVHFKYPRLLVVLFFEIPLIVVASAFLYNSVFSNNLSIFYKSLLLLIPMLLMRIWIFLLYSYSKRRLDHLMLFITVTFNTLTRQYKIQLKPDHELPANETFTLIQIKSKFVVFCDYWQIYSAIYAFMKDIENVRDEYDVYVRPYTSFCFLLGWTIPLIFQLHHIMLSTENILLLVHVLSAFSDHFIDEMMVFN